MEGIEGIRNGFYLKFKHWKLSETRLRDWKLLFSAREKKSIKFLLCSRAQFLRRTRKSLIQTNDPTRNNCLPFEFPLSLSC
jgi:hypothetical protein